VLVPRGDWRIRVGQSSTPVGIGGFSAEQDSIPVAIDSFPVGQNFDSRGIGRSL